MEQGPAERQLHPLGIQRPHLHPPGRDGGQQGADDRPDHRALARSGGPGDQHVGGQQAEPPGRAVLAPADRQPGQLHLSGDRQGGDRLGESVGADQFQQQRPGRDVADPAQPGAERVRQVLGLAGEVSGCLPGDQADAHQVDGPGPVYLAEDREHRLAAVVRGEPGQGHGGLPPAPVEPPPPPVPHRHRDEPGKPLGLHDPQPGQPDDSQRRQASDPGPPQPEPGGEYQRGRRVRERMGEREPGHPPDEPQQLDDEDDRFGGAVHRGAPHRGRERVAVVELGEVLASHSVTAARH